MTVNEQLRKVVLEPRVTLLDALRERLEPDRHQEGLRPGRVRRVHGAGGRRRVQVLPDAGGRCSRGRGHHDRGAGRGATLHPVQAAFIRHDAFQCGYCTPGQIMSAVALLDEGHAGSDDEIREWMSGNICRCGAIPEHRRRRPQGRARRGQPMRAFAYTRADAAECRYAGRADPASEVHRRRHRPDGPDAGRRGAPRALVDINALRLSGEIGTKAGGIGSARWPDERRRRAPDRAAGAAGDVAGAGARRVAAGAQHGVDRREPDAAHAMPVFPGPDLAVQQARPGSGCPAIDGAQPRGTPSSAAATTASPRTRPTWPWP